MNNIYQENIKVICKKCNTEMILESTMVNTGIYLCELCKHEVKVISIGNKEV